MTNAEKVLCVLGAGPNVGASVARKFASQGYKVAVVSRKKKDIVEGQLHVDGDFCDPSSMQDVFSEIRRSLGIPSVVVYNGESVVDEVSKSGEPTLSKDLSINCVSVLAAASEAVKGFRELSTNASRTFIFTGNILNMEPIAPLFSAGIGKAVTAHLIASASLAYKTESFKFYYADERKPDGTPVYGAIDGGAHASMYWQLAADKEQGPWLATFVKRRGYTDFSNKVSNL